MDGWMDVFLWQERGVVGEWMRLLDIFFFSFFFFKSATVAKNSTITFLPTPAS